MIPGDTIRVSFDHGFVRQGKQFVEGHYSGLARVVTMDSMLVNDETILRVRPEKWRHDVFIFGAEVEQ